MKQKSKYKPNTAISEYQFGKLFPDDESARAYIERQRWQGSVTCPCCGSCKVYRLSAKRGFWHCNGCWKQFSVRTGTIFQNSKVPLDKWLLAFYKLVTARKGDSSMHLSKELGVTQKTAWFMEHRIREAMSSGKYDYLFKGRVEVDETYCGGKNKNRHKDKKVIGSGPVGKSIVFGLRERKTGRAMSIVVPNGTRPVLQGMVEKFVKKGSTVNTDEAPVYNGLQAAGYAHDKVNHKNGQYVKYTKRFAVKRFVYDMASTNGVESMWALLKRGLYGTFHKFSPKHLPRYVDEFDFRLNEGNCKHMTMQRVDSLLWGSFGKYLSYKTLVGKTQAEVYDFGL